MMLSLSQRFLSAIDWGKQLIWGMALGAIAIPLASCNQTSGSEAQQNAAPEASQPSGSKRVTVLGTFVGEQQAQLEEALVPFEKETGIDVIYEGTDAFTTLLPVRIDSGDAPDIAMFPQPGLMRSLAEEGAIVPVTEILSREQLQSYYPDSWIDLSTVNNQIYGIWYRAAVKSLVWYNPKEFAKKGYSIPNTWAEMIALSDQIVAEGGTPWCLGLEGGNSSGWPGTDWIEDILLHAAGPDFYAKWVQHEVPFNAPQVQEAFQYFGEIAKNPNYVYGGKTGALSIAWGDSIAGIFTAPPECYMQKQANFISGFFPEGVVLGEDVDFFPTPIIEPKYGKALLVAGDIFSMLNDTPEARQLMAYIATPTPHEIWAAKGNFLSANKQVNLNVYPDEISRKEAELLTKAEIVQFDASDSMPGAVGTGTFWSGMMDFVAGASAADVTDKIEYYWPQGSELEDLTEVSAK
jgi:alpha-glucoside transport system substrate-binding protein